jgi:hypothetical protein
MVFHPAASRQKDPALYLLDRELNQIRLPEAVLSMLCPSEGEDLDLATSS